MATAAARRPGAMSCSPAGRALADGNVAAEARLLTAEAYAGDDIDPVTAELAERAIELARRAGDPLTESAALDELTAVQLARGELRAALASALRRAEILGPLPVTARSGLEHSDALSMATECAIAAGDLRTARQLAERVRDLPFHREEGHLATARLIVVAALAGDWDEALALAGQFREGWERAGRPRAGNLTRSAYAAATVHGLRGDDDARAAWLDIVDALATPGRPLSSMHFNEFFDALLLLHRGRAEAAMRLLLHAAGGVPDLGQRDVAAVVRGAVGRGGRRHRAPGRRRPDPPRAAGHAGQPGRRGHRGPGRGAGRATGARAGPGGRGAGGRRVPLSVGPDARGHRRGGTGPGGGRAGRDGRDRHGLASRMRLNGVWVARRTRLKPASRSTARQPPLARLRAEPQADLLVQRPRRADHRGQAVEGPPDRVQVLLERVAGHRLDQQQRAVRRQGLADVPGRPDRVAHVVQAVEHAHQVVAGTGEVLGGRDLEPGPLGHARLRRRLARGGDRGLVVVDAAGRSTARTPAP